MGLLLLSTTTDGAVTQTATGALESVWSEVYRAPNGGIEAVQRVEQTASGGVAASAQATSTATGAVEALLSVSRAATDALEALLSDRKSVV